MGARGPAEGLRQGPREALVQLMAAAEGGASATDGGGSAAAALAWSEPLAIRWRPCTSRRTARSHIGTVQLRWSCISCTMGK